MCEQCQKLDQEIRRLRDLAMFIADEQTLTGISVLILKCENENERCIQTINISSRLYRAIPVASPWQARRAGIAVPDLTKVCPRSA
jgi:hypothetical protein